MKMLCTVKLSPHRYKTPEGYLFCKDAIIARTGKQTYMESEIIEGSTSSEYIEVDRKPEQVFDERTMASFENVPLTIEHPSVSVGPDNYKELSVGHVQNIRRGQFEGQDVMFADIIVNDSEAINLIESGDMVELSCGYDCDITSGDNPEQINIRGNHVALCEQGRAGIARIQDARKAKIDTKRLDGMVSYHYRTDEANGLDMSEFENRFITEYMPEELSRQATKEEKEYVREKIKSYVRDHWGAKPVATDSATKGTLIQEFGKQGKQYKIIKVVGNVIYAENLVTKDIVLFKRNEEGIEWAVITKSDLRDSEQNEKQYSIVVDFASSSGREGRRPFSDLEKAVDAAKRYVEDSNDKGKFSVADVLVYVTEGNNPRMVAHAKIMGKPSGKKTSAGAIIPLPGADFHVEVYSEEPEWKEKLEKATADLIKNSGAEKVYRVHHLSVARGKYFIDAEHLTLEQAKEIFDEVVKHLSESCKNNPYRNEYEVFLDEDTDDFNEEVIKSASINKVGKVKFLDSVRLGDRTLEPEEVPNVDVATAFEKDGYLWAKDKSESQLLSRAYWSADGGETWNSCGLYRKSENRADKSHRTQAGKAVFRATNSKGVQKEIGRNVLTWYTNNPGEKYRDDMEIDHIDGDYTNDAIFNLRRVTHEENMRFERERKKKKDSRRVARDASEGMVFHHKNGNDYPVRERTLSEMKDRLKKFGCVLVLKDPKEKGQFQYIEGTQFVSPANGNIYAKFIDHGGNERVLMVADYDDYVKEVLAGVNDSWGISLQGEGQGSWLDDQDKPTDDPRRAKKFNSREEAEGYCRSHCNGMVKKMGDARRLSQSDSSPSEFNVDEAKAEIERLLTGEGIEFSSIDDSWGSITVDFLEPKEMKKAHKLLWKRYDIEDFDDEDGLYIAIYGENDPYEEEDPFGEPATETITLGDSGDKFTGFDLLRGNASKEFKAYLRDRGLYFEPSDNGDYVHFEVRNADAYVKQRAEDIRKHWARFADSYTRKFYSKAIKALEDQLKHLERNRTLDQNQFEYERQKALLKKKIKDLISEYKKKLDGYGA